MRFFLIVALSALLVGCRTSAPALQIAGSTSVQPVAEVLAEAYEQATGARVSIQGGGSTAGVQAVLNGVAGMGAVSRKLTADESARGLVAHTIGRDVLAVVVHPSNPVGKLSLEQLRAVFAGTVTDWASVGGKPGPIHLVTREAGSGSREAFRTVVGPISDRAIVQNSSGAIRVSVMDDPRAIGYVSLGALRLGGLKPLAIDGRMPGGPGYLLVRDLSLVTRGRPTGAVAAFLSFALSPAGQRLISEEGLVPVRDLTKEN